jgi:hypothetical protein
MGRTEAHRVDRRQGPMGANAVSFMTAWGAASMVFYADRVALGMDVKSILNELLTKNIFVA